MEDFGKVWTAYYHEFSPHLGPRKVRKNCEPRFLTRADAIGSIVLVHGLSDSPRYMWDIASHFYKVHRYNVYLPLLHFHGLKNPRGMEGVEMEEWKRNVRFAVESAYRMTPGKVSIGGLSTGGALSFYAACTSPRINGDLFLFSAALDLTVKSSGTLGDIAERLLRSRRLTNFLDKRGGNLWGDNPCKYDYIDYDAARELVRVIKETDSLMGSFDKRNPFPKRVFAAHSEADTTANIAGIKTLQRKTQPGCFKSFYIPKKYEVTHGGLVLASRVGDENSKKSTPPNIRFTQMMKAMDRFVAGAWQSHEATRVRKRSMIL